MHRPYTAHLSESWHCVRVSSALSDCSLTHIIRLTAKRIHRGHPFAITSFNAQASNGNLPTSIPTSLNHSAYGRPHLAEREISMLPTNSGVSSLSASGNRSPSRGGLIMFQRGGSPCAWQGRDLTLISLPHGLRGGVSHKIAWRYIRKKAEMLKC